MKKTLLLLLVSILTRPIDQLQAQHKYWVFFEDKNTELATYSTSKETVANRSALHLELYQFTDIPVTGEYVRKVSDYCEVLYKSRWLNAVSVAASSQQIKEVQELPFVKRISNISTALFLTEVSHLATPVKNKNTVLSQINGRYLREEGLTGQHVKVGVIDGKFGNADNTPSLQHVFRQGRVKAAKDFLSTNDIFEETDNPSDRHGTAVLHMIAGEDHTTRYGLANDGMFYLARTENSELEYRGEEDAWVAALEWLDSTGVRLVNSSLGYSTDFDKAAHNYTPQDMDGQTSVVAKAAKMAVTQKGMILVVSAGNEGNNAKWKVITTPADVEEVITVGATNTENLRSEVSSIGPTNGSFLKPDVVCMSVGGTSLAAPVITGMIACMLQKDPSLTSGEIRDIISRSSHLYPYGNNYVGYGIPDAKKIIQYLTDSSQIEPHHEEVRAKKSVWLLKGKNYARRDFTIYHKSNQRTVIKQTQVSSGRRGLKVTKHKEAQRTTVSSGDTTLEIVWPDETNLN